MVDISKLLHVVGGNSNSTDIKRLNPEGTSKIDISKLLAGRGKAGEGKLGISKPGATNNGPGVMKLDGTLIVPDKLAGVNDGKEITSKEEATYNNEKGSLIRYADGSMEFRVQNSNNMSILMFNSEKEFNAKSPHLELRGTLKFTPQKVITFQKSVEFTKTYHENGKIAHQEVKNEKGVLLNVVDFNENGKPTKRIVYDKDGKLQTTSTYTYPDENTQLIEEYDKDNNLKSKATVKWDGDKRISGEWQYPDGAKMRSAVYDKDGKIATLKEYFEDGKIKSDTVYYPNGVIKTQKIYNEQGTVIKNITDEIDGKIDVSSQKAQGDCYLMSSIIAIKGMENGPELLSNLIKISTNEKGEKVYTVTLPGAQMAAEALKSENGIKPGSCAITGTYTFTEAEMQEILQQAGRRYSIGDGDVILLEAAFEKYREEVAATLKANNIKPGSIDPQYAGLATGTNEKNILSGGIAEDAIFVLTGKQSQVYYDPNPSNALSLKDLRNDKATIVKINKGTPGASSASDMEDTKSVDDIMSSIKKSSSKKSGSKTQNKKIKGATSSIDGERNRQKSELDKMLDDIMKDSADGHIDNPATASFRTVNENGRVSGHALTIKSVTADTVVLINPWYPDKDLVMSREDFLEAACHVTITDMDGSTTKRKPKDKQQVNPNDSNLNKLPPELQKIIKQIKAKGKGNQNPQHANNLSEKQVAEYREKAYKYFKA